MFFSPKASAIMSGVFCFFHSLYQLPKVESDKKIFGGFKNTSYFCGCMIDLGYPPHTLLREQL